MPICAARSFSTDGEQRRHRCLYEVSAGLTTRQGKPKNGGDFASRCATARRIPLKTSRGVEWPPPERKVCTCDAGPGLGARLRAHFDQRQLLPALLAGRIVAFVHRRQYQKNPGLRSRPYVAQSTETNRPAADIVISVLRVSTSAVENCREKV